MTDMTVAEVVAATRCPGDAVAVLWPLLLGALKGYGVGVDSRASQAGLASMVALETRSEFRSIVENLRYTSALRLTKVFPTRLPTIESAVPFVNRPEDLANHVYAGRGGNGDAASGDGWRYRGRGPIQLTLHENYARCGLAIGEDLLGNPDAVLVPEVGAKTAVWFWVTKGIPRLCDEGRWRQARATVNPALLGLNEFLTMVRAFGFAR